MAGNLAAEVSDLKVRVAEIAPVCVINDDTTLANIATSTKTVTNTALTITGSVGTTDTYSYVCWAGN